MQAETILVVDDERGILLALKGILEDEGYRPFSSRTASPRCGGCASSPSTSCCSTSGSRDATAWRSSRRSTKGWPTIPVVMMSGHGTIETAVRTTKLGAYDFIEKPLSLEKTLLVLRHALEERRLTRENSELLRQAESVGRDRRRGPGDRRTAPPGRPRRRGLGTGPGHRRARHGQGTGGALDSRALAAAAAAVHRGQLRRAARRTRRERTLRARARRLHRGGGSAPREVRAGGRRHAVLRRDRRHDACARRGRSCGCSRARASSGSAAASRCGSTCG